MLHVLDKITCHMLPIDCLLLALDAHMLSHHGYGPGPGPEAQGAAQAAAVTGKASSLNSSLGFGPGPGPMSMMAEHICIKRKQ